MKKTGRIVCIGFLVAVALGDLAILYAGTGAMSFGPGFEVSCSNSLCVQSAQGTWAAMR